MKIKDLIAMCDNIGPDTDLMIYHSPDDRKYFTSNWNSCKAESLWNSEMRISSFEFVRDFVVVVLA